MAVPTAARSIKALSDLLHKHFPELHWNKARYIGEGWDHEVLILDHALVFRFPADDEYQALLQHEIEILRRLAPLVQAQIPQYRYVAADSSCAGYPKVPGVQLTSDRYHALPATEQRAVQKQLADFLSRLHSIDPASDKAFEKVAESYLLQDQADVKRAAARGRCGSSITISTVHICSGMAGNSVSLTSAI